MFFYLSKILDFLINPLVWILLLMVLSLRATKKYNKAKWLRWAILVFYIVSLDVLSLLAINAWELPALPINQLEKHKVAVVLGGFTVMENEPHDRVYTNSEADRLLHAIQLYKLGRVDYILVTGGTASLWKIHGTEGELAQKLLLIFGVPTKAILVENASKNTHENAENSRKLLESKNLWGSEVLLVTSAFHMRRAEACFLKSGYKVLPYPTSMRAHVINWVNPAIYFVPSLDSLNRWNLLLHEWVGYISYKVLGYC
jgi:uncharacterized SAM-binding protein YcdF (DUF218 family)